MRTVLHHFEYATEATLLTWAGKEEENASTTTATDDENNDAPTAQPDKQIEITSDTRLKDLFEVYPHLKKELAARYPSFKMLNTPLGKLILKKATVRTAAERSGLGEERFIQLLKDCI